ncbi:MAG: peptidylprolyl isomerase [Paracoccaceae bacterium]
MSSIKSTLIAACLAFVIGGTSTDAQNVFAPVARVNESVITEFEVQQRIRFLQILNAPGATPDGALNALIEDRLRIQESSSLGLELSDEGLQEGLSEFAGRANLSTDEFIEALEGAGIARETFRDFVAAQLTWRDLIRARFGNRVQVTESDIDRAVEASSNSTSGIRVLLSELIMPAPPNQIEQVRARAEEIAQSQTEAEFSAFARQFSATASRQAGGRLDWVDLSTLPPNLRPLILGLAPGEVTTPLNIPNAIALFQLRDIEETGRSQREYAAVEYAAYYIDGGRSQASLARANSIKDRVDVCDDLYGVAKGQPEEVLERGSLPPEEIPQDIAIELAKLDAGEVSTNIVRADGNTLVFLMLCGRTPAQEEEINRDSVRAELQQQRFGGFARAYLEDIRSDAIIEVFNN